MKNNHWWACGWKIRCATVTTMRVKYYNNNHPWRFLVEWVVSSYPQQQLCVIDSSYGHGNTVNFRN